MARLATPATRPDAKLIADLERANIHPLWDRYKTITPLAPRSVDGPAHWRWGDVEPLTERAAHEVPIEDVVERARVTRGVTSSRAPTGRLCCAASAAYKTGSSSSPMRVR